MSDDESVTVMPMEFGGRKLESTTKDGSDLDEDEKNKLEELKVIVVVEGDAEYNKKSRTA